MHNLFFSSLLFFSIIASAKSGSISGSVFQKITKEPVPGANVIIQGTTKGSTTDEFGTYLIDNLEPGVYNIQVSFIGFEPQIKYEVEVTADRPAFIDFELEETSEKLDEVEVVASQSFYKKEESPLSLRSIGVNEIKRAPGGNRDISKVVRSLPGVASTVSFRNDILIRGGAPNENKYYLDGMELPVINHFQTQGSSGGPVGIINVDFIQEVDFYAGAFPANRGNTLSSIFEFKQKEGRLDKWTLNGILGASDLGVTLEGPLSNKTSMIFSARRSYLQFLFGVLGLPFLPSYNDYQFKVKHKFSPKHQLSMISIGAYDDFELNLDADETEEQRYLLNNLPVTKQWNYTIGAKYEWFRTKGVTSFFLSRNMLNNTAFKYQNNDESDPANKILDYSSQEIENKFRVEEYYDLKNDVQVSYGLQYSYVKYYVNTFNKISTPDSIFIADFNSYLPFNTYGLFAQVNKGFWNKKLIMSLGVRTDANDYSAQMNNLFEQLSPRFSAAYYLAPSFSINFNTGIYYQLPPYTVLGYRDGQTGELVNKSNGIDYIKSTHFVVGIEKTFTNNLRVSIEGFIKQYDDYPFLLTDSISMANLGADFGVIGNEPAASISTGQSYGVEFLAQQKLWKGWYGLASYTFVRSSFADKNGELVPSAWDFTHLISLTAGKKFKRNWELGVRWFLTGGAPFTPFDVQRSVQMDNWNVNGAGIPDYSRLNEGRLNAYHQLDIRIDKKYYFKKWSLNFFFDIQNFYNQTIPLQDLIDVEKDEFDSPIEDPENPGFYIPKFLPNSAGTVLPTLGIIVEI